MRLRTVFSGAVVGLLLAVGSFGCGGAQEDYTVVSRPQETGAIDAAPVQRDEVELSAATRRQLKACIDQRAGQWTERSHAVQIDAKANERGGIQEVKLRDTTLRDDQVEICLLQAIAAMTIPEHALRLRSSRPFSGGEQMQRERRGPMGSSNAETPWVLLGPFVVEAIGVDVIIEVTVVIIAVVGTIVRPRKKPKDECAEKYSECMDTPLGNRQVDKPGHSLCETCRQTCVNDEAWPWAVKVTQRWESCRY